MTWRTPLWLCLWLPVCMPLAADEALACQHEELAQVAFTAPDAADRLQVLVTGNPCREASVIIRLHSADGREIYHYQGELMAHLPFVIYEPELQPLVAYFAQKVVRDGFIRSTADLPPWQPVEIYYDHTNDIIVVPEPEYEALRQQRRPIFWHATGGATWVHLVYSPESGQARLIMRGGVFSSPEDDH